MFLYSPWAKQMNVYGRWFRFFALDIFIIIMFCYSPSWSILFCEAPLELIICKTVRFFPKTCQAARHPDTRLFDVREAFKRTLYTPGTWFSGIYSRIHRNFFVFGALGGASAQQTPDHYLVPCTTDPGPGTPYLIARHRGSRPEV